VLDNTWATLLGFRAFDHGVDVSVHAATKYIGGHSDVLLGAIVANTETFPHCTGCGPTWA
jgi:cystathionine beta-lyase